MNNLLIGPIKDVQAGNVAVTATPGGATAPAPLTGRAHRGRRPVEGATAPAPAPAPLTDYTVYPADTDDREVLAFSKAGACQEVFVSARSGGPGRAWDAAFGPDGHLYVSDNTYKKVRRYNWSAGAAISPSAAGWAATEGYPHGLAWRGSTLYVATATGVERSSSTGSALGYFGDASRSPSTSGATAVVSPHDPVFCAGNSMYVADRSPGAILYCSASAGTYLGQIPGSRSPDAYRATGVECGTAMSGSGTSLYQSGDDGGRVNEINPSTKALVRTVTSLIDEPYGMDLSGSGVLYVANKDGDNIVKISSGAPAVFAAGNRMDGPRGLTVGPLYSGSASGSSGPSRQSSPPPQQQQNDGPGIIVSHGSAALFSPLQLAPGQSATLSVRAADPDGDAVSITASTDTLPPSSISVADPGGGTATVTLTSAGLPPGTYVFWIEASDGKEGEREPYAVIVA